MEEKLQRAKHLAKLILKWHLEFGKAKVQELDPNFAQIYLNKLGSLQGLGLNERDNIRKIADEQRKGIFEHFYTQHIPKMLWDEFNQGSYFETLGDVAGRILNLLAASETLKENAEVFALPKGWEKTSQLLHPVSVTIPCKSGEMASQILRTFFASLAYREEMGIGGCELMIAMNEDLLDGGSTLIESGLISVYSPACFDFQLATGENNLITHVLEGSISIKDVVIGCDSSYIENHQ